jgi:hypothetical protein
MTPRERKKPSDQPLKVRVTRGGLEISIGIETLAWAFERTPYAQPYSDEHSNYRQRLRVSDPLEFAHDVRRALTDEEADGSTPLSDLLDKMCEAAAEGGSLGVEECDEEARE